MPSPEEQAYSAVERAYGQSDFVRALELAEALQPQLQQNRSDLLDQRLQLLIGHIHLYGLGQPHQAELAYRTVLEGCREPQYRQLAEQSLQLCADQASATAEPARPQTDTSAETLEAAERPATPWLAQLNEPQAALAQIQAAWATAVPTRAQPEPPLLTGEAATPWAQGADATATPEVPDAEASRSAGDAPAMPAAAPEPAPSDADATELERGLLLVRLSSRGARPSEPGPAVAEPPAPSESTSVPAPSLGAAWTMFKRHWQTYLILEGLVVVSALAGVLLQVIGAGLPGLALAVGAIAINLWSNLLGVSLQMLPALAFHSGAHPSAKAMLQLLRRDFWRYIRAGVVVGLATVVGLLLLILPGLLVAIATPVVIRRVTCQRQAAVPALIASVREVGSSPAGAGLLQWELIAGLLVLASVLLCGLPLLITVPLGGILVQQYLASSGLGSGQD